MPDKEDKKDKKHSGMSYYRMEGTELEAWICTDLNRYFGEAPEKIYCAAIPLGLIPQTLPEP
jgi:hypothetical protein